MNALAKLYEQAQNGSEQAALELAAQLEALRQRLARERLIEFTRYTFDEYVCSWHHKVIASYLDRVALSQLQPQHPDAITRLMVFVPPRHGKSELTSRRFPAYLLGRDPNLRVVAASYSADLARSMNRDAQRVIDSETYRELFPDTCLSGMRVRTDHRGSYLRNADEFEVVGHRGGFKSVGVCGGITGRGFNVGIIDDPVKDRMEAESKVYRERVVDWYTSTFYSRRDKANAAIVLIMTRWHQGDLAGWLLNEMKEGRGDQWTVLWLPALAEPDNPFKVPVELVDQRQPGEALWPYLFDREELLATMRQSERDATSIYQQRPSPMGGGMIKKAWLRYAELREGGTAVQLDSGLVYRLRDARAVFLTVDLAISKKDHADWTVIAAWAIVGDGQLVLLDVLRDRMEGPQHVPALRSMAARWQAKTIWVETVAFQLGVVQAARVARPPLPVREYQPNGDKVARAIAATPCMEAGRFHVVRGAWLADWEDEVFAFPDGNHDDQVDTVSCAVDVAENHLRGLPTLPQLPPVRAHRYDHGVTTRIE